MSSPQLVEYDGSRRLVAGRARYPTPPEPGTLLGPKDITRELLVVLGQDGGHTLVGYAAQDDVDAAHARIAAGGAPRSLAEQQLRPPAPPLLRRKDQR